MFGLGKYGSRGNAQSKVRTASSVWTRAVSPVIFQGATLENHFTVYQVAGSVNNENIIAYWSHWIPKEKRKRKKKTAEAPLPLRREMFPFSRSVASAKRQHTSLGWDAPQIRAPRRGATEDCPTYSVPPKIGCVKLRLFNGFWG